MRNARQGPPRNAIVKPSCVGVGIDSVYLGFHATVHDDLIFHLEVAKEVAQSGVPSPVEFGGEQFKVEPYSAGKSYPLCLKGCGFTLGVAKKGGLSSPQLYAKVDAHRLWENGDGPNGLAHAWRTLERIARLVHHGDAPVLAVTSRVDLAADFQGIDFGRAALGEFLTRAGAATRFVETEHQARRHPTGFSFGRGDFMARVYDKSREIATSGKAWFWPLWLARGAVEGEPVWRVELQARREAIKGVAVLLPGVEEVPNLDTLEGLTIALGPLWRYGVGLPGATARNKRPMGWLSWRVPDEQERGRWAVRPEWETVRSVEWSGSAVDAEVLREARRTITWERLLPGVTGMAISMAATIGEFREHRAWDAIKRAARGRLEARGVTWDEAVRVRAIVMALDRAHVDRAVWLALEGRKLDEATRAEIARNTRATLEASGVKQAAKFVLEERLTRPEVVAPKSLEVFEARVEEERNDEGEE